MVRSVVRTNAVNASIGMGSGASFGPVTPPCAWKPWQAQQPCWIYAALPFSAEAANAPPQPNTRPAASAASPLTRTKRMGGPPYRGWVQTLSSAGWPDFTTATACLMAGPSSAGSLIGPFAHQPIDSASL